MSEQHEEIIDAEFNGRQVKEESGGLVLATEVLPAGLPIIPLRPRPAFPNMFIPMIVNDRQHIQAVKRAMESTSRAVGLVLVKEPDEPDGPNNLHRVGVAGKIVRLNHADDDSAQFLVNTLERFTVEDLTESAEGYFARARYYYGAELSVNTELKAYSMAVLATLKELIQINPLYSEEIKLFLSRSSLDDPGRLADFAASLTSADGQELQQVLESFDVRRRIDLILVLLKKELEVTRLQTKITKQIEEKISSQQREFFLREQLKAIKKELGLEKDAKTTEIEKFEERLKGMKLNDDYRLLPRLEKGSRVLFVGSNSATRPRLGSAAYCVSQAASYMLQECLKRELEKEGIGVSLAIPSPVNTPMVANQMAADPELFPDGMEYRRLREQGRLHRARNGCKILSLAAHRRFGRRIFFAPVGHPGCISPRILAWEREIVSINVTKALGLFQEPGPC